MKEVKLFFDEDARPSNFPWVAEVTLYDGGVERGYGTSPGEALEDLDSVLEDL